MKHLRKFNESIKEDIDIDYIKSVFVDFIEDGATIIGLKTCEITIKIPEISSRERFSSTIESFIDYSDRWTNTLRDIQSCIKRVIDEYPDMNYKVSYSSYDKLIVTFSMKELIP